MISVIGLGNAASAIVDCFKDTPQYDVFKLNDQVKKSSKYNFKIKSFDEPEQYEANIPNLQKFSQTSMRMFSSLSSEAHIARTTHWVY